MNLNLLMTDGINHLLKTAGRYYLKSGPGRAFLAKTAPKLRKGAKLRRQGEATGAPIPAFLIASIASRCNLHCAGCYARAGGACGGEATAPDLTASEWARVFDEAAALGVSFILLAGGEPLLRRDVLEAAAANAGLIFPVFTNGTLMDDGMLELFNRHRHLVPVLSIEGGEDATDERRGKGTYAGVLNVMDRLASKGILFGASVTVTRRNMDAVLCGQFAQTLRQKGCGLVVYVEYVPAEPGTDALCLSLQDLETMQRRILAVRNGLDDMVVLAFPGDEDAMGGCLAAGRGFFHINPSGGAEPCPFSPYAGHNVKDTSLLTVLQSHYFAQLRSLAEDADPHTGGCVLFQRQAQVRQLLNG